MTLQQIEVFLEQVGEQVKQDRRDHLLLRRAARALKGLNSSCRVRSWPVE